MRGAVLAVAVAIAGVARAGEPTPATTPTSAGTATPAPASTATLLIHLTGARSALGTLVVSVFTQGDGWPKLARAARVVTLPAVEGPVEVRVEGLPPGPCAVSAFHDENGNGKLDMRWFPLPHPAERTGASNGATGRFGPPAFDAARMDCPAGDTAAPVALAD